MKYMIQVVCIFSVLVGSVFAQDEGQNQEQEPVMLGKEFATVLAGRLVNEYVTSKKLETEFPSFAPVYNILQEAVGTFVTVDILQSADPLLANVTWDQELPSLVLEQSIDVAKKHGMKEIEIAGMMQDFFKVFHRVNNYLRFMDKPLGEAFALELGFYRLTSINFYERKRNYLEAEDSFYKSWDFSVEYFDTQCPLQETPEFQQQCYQHGLMAAELFTEMNAFLVVLVILSEELPETIVREGGPQVSSATVYILESWKTILSEGQLSHVRQRLEEIERVLAEKVQQITLASSI